jgi:hypothetical protein
MPLTNYSFDTFVAQQMSQLTAPAASPIGAEFASSSTWFADFVLNSIFVKPLSMQGRRVAFAWLRRANAAVESYDEACLSLRDLTSGKNRIRAFFRALDKIEHALAMAYQANYFARKALNYPLFAPNDGSVLQRLNEIYNVSRHTDLSRLSDENIHPVWLTNDGIHCATASLEYVEFESVLRELAKVASQIANMADQT